MSLLLEISDIVNYAPSSLTWELFCNILIVFVAISICRYECARFCVADVFHLAKGFFNTYPTHIPQCSSDGRHVCERCRVIRFAAVLQRKVYRDSTIDCLRLLPVLLEDVSKRCNSKCDVKLGSCINCDLPGI